MQVTRPIYRTHTTNANYILNQISIGQIGSGTLTRPDVVERVRDYQTFNMSATYSGLKNLRLTAGVKNILDTDPPFAITYDTDTGAGSSWEPRVADPRGRAFTLLAEYKF